MQIFVKALKGETYVFDLDKNDNVLEIRKQLSSKTGIPVEEIRLIFTGKQLEDGRTLKYYKIEKDSIINSVLRIRGGIRDGSHIKVQDTTMIDEYF
jgi:hypothetical protein